MPSLPRFMVVALSMIAFGLVVAPAARAQDGTGPGTTPPPVSAPDILRPTPPPAPSPPVPAPRAADPPPRAAPPPARVPEPRRVPPPAVRTPLTRVHATAPPPVLHARERPPELDHQ